MKFKNILLITFFYVIANTNLDEFLTKKIGDDGKSLTVTITDNVTTMKEANIYIDQFMEDNTGGIYQYTMTLLLRKA
jgi:hypothetical protein